MADKGIKFVLFDSIYKINVKGWYVPFHQTNDFQN